MINVYTAALHDAFNTLSARKVHQIIADVCRLQRATDVRRASAAPAAGGSATATESIPVDHEVSEEDRDGDEVAKRRWTTPAPRRGVEPSSP